MCLERSKLLNPMKSLSDSDFNWDSDYSVKFSTTVNFKFLISWPLNSSKYSSESILSFILLSKCVIILDWIKFSRVLSVSNTSIAKNPRGIAFCAPLFHSEALNLRLGM